MEIKCVSKSWKFLSRTGYKIIYIFKKLIACIEKAVLLLFLTGELWSCTHCHRSFKYQRTMLLHKRFECCDFSSKDHHFFTTNTDKPDTSEKEVTKPNTNRDTQSNKKDKKSSIGHFVTSRDSEKPESLFEVRQKQDSELITTESRKSSLSPETEILDVKKFLLKGTFATPLQYKMNADLESKCKEALKGLREHLRSTAQRDDNFLKILEPVKDKHSCTSLSCFSESGTSHGNHVTQKSKISNLLSLLSSRPRSTKSLEEKSLAEFHKKEFRKKFQGNEHYLRRHLYRSRVRNGDTRMSQEKLGAFTPHFNASALLKINNRAQLSTSFPGLLRSQGRNPGNEYSRSQILSFPESFKKEKNPVLHCFSGQNRNYSFFRPSVLQQKSSEQSRHFDKGDFRYRHYFSQSALRPQTLRLSEPIRCEEHFKEKDMSLHRSAFCPYISSRNKRFGNQSKLFQTKTEKDSEFDTTTDSEEVPLKQFEVFENSKIYVDPLTTKELEADDGRFFEQTVFRPFDHDKCLSITLNSTNELNHKDNKTFERKAPLENDISSFSKATSHQNSSKPINLPLDLKSNTSTEPALLQCIPKTVSSREEICHHSSSEHAQSYHQKFQDLALYHVPPSFQAAKDNGHHDFISLPGFAHSHMHRPHFLSYMAPRVVRHATTSPARDQGFTCDFCGKVYCRKYVLKIHMRTHTGFKPLQCKVCDKSFSDPSNMKKHVKLHETEHTVHKCKHCGRNFVRYRGLLNHIKAKHSLPSSFGYY